MEKYIQPFVEVCESVFRDFLQTEVRADRPHFIDRSEANNWDISAVIGLTGEARGAVVISMKLNLALSLTSTLTGQQHTGLDDEVVDAIGEVVNIIAGNAKRGLEESFRLVISLPTIVRGNNHSVIWPTEQTRIICIPFRLPSGDTFCLSVAIEAVG
ncbi:chemotaxis protein CheX [Spirochaeta lutea]|uniref:Inhibitor of MCP methylation n=1 Tax=Spirochaeta lutea TaxID=1480694 RepID=A0A098QW05_9SPIO|nr:chemotaxis protein CheX [Spirochaeta lutea]KGE72050.1 inhibitor of MCP methylation [Spirochaeta lutea]